jgi:hypothetical protein
MVPVDQGAPLPLPTRERDAVEQVAPDTSTVGTALSIGGAKDMLLSRYLTIPCIGVIDLDATELPINDQEILEAVTDRVFTHPSLLDAIMSGPLAPRQDGDASGSASSTAQEAVEGVLGEFGVDAESAAIAPPLPTAGALRTRPCPRL